MTSHDGSLVELRVRRREVEPESRAIFNHRQKLVVRPTTEKREEIRLIECRSNGHDRFVGRYQLWAFYDCLNTTDIKSRFLRRFVLK